MDRLRIGVIGTGKIAQTLHIPNVLFSDRTELVALSNPHPEKMERIIEKFGIEGVSTYTDYKDLLKRDDVDAVIIATPNAYHAPITVEALRAGKHVLVEKPMATSSKEALEMLEESKRSGKILMVNHSQRFFPHHMKAKEIIESGMLGEIRLVKTMFGHSGPENWSPSARWFFEKDKAMFGALGDLGVHKVDLIRFLTGLEIEECFAMLGTLEKSGNVEDISSAVLRLSNGALATLDSNWITKGLEENYTVIYGEYGTLKIGYSDPTKIDMYLIKPVNYHGEIRLRPLFTNEDPYWKMPVVEHFAKVCLGEEKPVVRPEDGYIAIKVIEALFESHRTGRSVRLS